MMPQKMQGWCRGAADRTLLNDDTRWCVIPGPHGIQEVILGGRNDSHFTDWEMS